MVIFAPPTFGPRTDRHSGEIEPQSNSERLAIHLCSPVRLALQVNVARPAFDDEPLRSFSSKCLTMPWQVFRRYQVFGRRGTVLELI